MRYGICDDHVQYESGRGITGDTVDGGQFADEAPTGYTYDAAYSEGTSSGVITADDPATAEDESLVLKLYYRINRHTVTYNLNGGTGDMETTFKPVTQDYDTGFPVTDVLPTWDGYIFLGWSSSLGDNDVATAEYKSTEAPRATFQLTSDVTLTAVWAKVDALFSGAVAATKVYGQNDPDDVVTNLEALLDAARESLGMSGNAVDIASATREAGENVDEDE